MQHREGGNMYRWALLCNFLISVQLGSAESLNKILGIVGRISITQIDYDVAKEKYNKIEKFIPDQLIQKGKSLKTKVIDYLIINAIVDMTAEEETIQVNEASSACLITPNIFVLYNQVAQKIGFTPLDPSVMKLGYLGRPLAEALELQGGELLDYLQNLQVKFLDKNGKGYELNLLAINLYVHLLLGNWNDKKQYIANQLAEKNPANTFFTYIAKGPMDSQVAQLNKLVPSKPPEAPREWIWERKDIDSSSSPVKNLENITHIEDIYKPKTSYGWDLIFAINLLLKDPAK